MKSNQLRTRSFKKLRECVAYVENVNLLKSENEAKLKVWSIEMLPYQDANGKQRNNRAFISGTVEGDSYFFIFNETNLIFQTFIICMFNVIGNLIMK